MSVARPSVRFTTTPDGVAIGFWEIGSGPTLLIAQNRSLSHAELEWAVPSMAALYEELARYLRVVRFDPRGSGVSGDPPDGDLTLDGLVADILAVVNAVGVERLDVLGAVSFGPAAVAFAASKPELVTHLVLCDTGPRLSELPLNAYVKATDALVELGVVPSLGQLFPKSPTDDLPALERLMRASLYDRSPIRPRDLSAFDVTHFLGRVRAPTLVLKSTNSLYSDVTQTRALLAGIPGAELRMVPGTMAPWLADRDSVVEAFVSFLTSGHHRPDRSAGGGLLTIVFTDLVSSTRVLTRQGDREARRAFADVESLVAELSSRHGGRVIKNLGDGSLLTFQSTQKALDFALELQERMEENPLELRIGMAAGEPIQEGDDVHGAVVVQASRVADLGGAGDVIVSDSVRQLALGKGFEFAPRGEVVLDGFDEAQRVWKVVRSRRP